MTVYWKNQFQLDGEVQTGASGAPEVLDAPVVSQDAQDRPVAACASCAAGEQTYGGSAMGPPFHAFETRDPCFFTECPLQRDRWLAEQRIRKIALELHEALRRLHTAAIDAYKMGRLDPLSFVHAGNVLAKATAE